MSTSNTTCQYLNRRTGSSRRDWRVADLQPFVSIVSFASVTWEFTRRKRVDTDQIGQLSGACYGFVSWLADLEFARIA